MTKSLIDNLRIQAQKAWNLHFNECSDQGIWTKLNAGIEDIKNFEFSWKLKWIEAQLENLSKEQNDKN